MISLGSDNHSGIHPNILSRLQESNIGHSASYGTDPITDEAKKLFKEIFGETCQSFFVFNGTAANVLALKSLVKSYESIICAEDSHLNVDECGAPENQIGCKLIKLPSPDGKIKAADILSVMIRKGDQHFSQVKAVSITQPTELGTMYSVEELNEIKKICKESKLFLHIDGARFVYAPVFLKTSFKELCKDVDALSFGGTKNGLLFGEVVLLFNKTSDFKFIRKQSMQLPSKMRFLSGQFIELLSTGLYKEIAVNGITLAKYLQEKLCNIDELEVTQKVQANSVFVKIPQPWIKPLREKFFFYIWNESTFEARLMLSYDSTKEHIDSFVEHLLNVKKQFPIDNKNNKESLLC